ASGGATLRRQSNGGVRIRHPSLHDLGGVFQHELDFLALRPRESSQDEIRRIHPSGWPTDSDLHTGELAVSQSPLDRAEAIVTTRTPADLETETSEWQVDVVVDDQHLSLAHSEVVTQGANRLTRFVHVGQRRRRYNLFARDPEVGDLDTQPGRCPLPPFAGGYNHPIDDFEPDVVTGGLVVGPRISEPDYRFHWPQPVSSDSPPSEEASSSAGASSASGASSTASPSATSASGSSISAAGT